MDPLQNIEDKKAQLDVGVMGARIYQGSLDESGNMLIAFFVTVAFFRGMMGSGHDAREEGGEDKSQ